MRGILHICISCLSFRNRLSHLSLYPHRTSSLRFLQLHKPAFAFLAPTLSLSLSFCFSNSLIFDSSRATCTRRGNPRAQTRVRIRNIRGVHIHVRGYAETETSRSRTRCSNDKVKHLSGSRSILVFIKATRYLQHLVFRRCPRRQSNEHAWAHPARAFVPTAGSFSSTLLCRPSTLIPTTSVTFTRSRTADWSFPGPEMTPQEFAYGTQLTRLYKTKFWHAP